MVKVVQSFSILNVTVFLSNKTSYLDAAKKNMTLTGFIRKTKCLQKASFTTN